MKLSRISRRRLPRTRDAIFSNRCLRRGESGSTSKRCSTKASHQLILRTSISDSPQLPLRQVKTVMKVRKMMEAVRRVKKKPRKRKERKVKARKVEVVMEMIKRKLSRLVRPKLLQSSKNSRKSTLKTGRTGMKLKITSSSLIQRWPRLRSCPILRRSSRKRLTI